MTNIVILIVDVFFTLGWYGVPCAGIYGSAIAHGVGLSLQITLLFFLFWNYSQKYNTHSYYLKKRYLIKIITLTGPFAVGKCFESFIYFLFYVFCSMADVNTMTIIGITNSFYLLVTFFLEGLARGVSSMCSNLLGQGDRIQAQQVIRSALIIHAVISSVIAIIIIFFFTPLFWLLRSLFLSNQSCSITHLLINRIHTSFYYVMIYFMADGIGRIYMNFLTAAGDTRFILYTYCFNACFILGIPSYILIAKWHKGAECGWIILTAYATSNACLYAYRYYHDYWIGQYHDDH